MIDYLKNPENCDVPSQTKAKRFFDQIKKTSLYPAPCLVVYKNDDSPDTLASFSWVIEDPPTETTAIIPAFFKDNNAAAEYDDFKIIRLQPGNFFLLDNVLFTLQYSGIEGCVLKQVTCLYSSRMVNIYSQLKHGRPLLWSLGYLYRKTQKELGVAWIGFDPHNLDDDFDMPDAVIPVWTEDNSNFKDCPFEEITVVDINPDDIFEHQETDYQLCLEEREEEDYFYIRPVFEKLESLPS